MGESVCAYIARRRAPMALGRLQLVSIVIRGQGGRGEEHGGGEVRAAGHQEQCGARAAAQGPPLCHGAADFVTKK